MTIKQEGPLPTPRSSNKGSSQTEKKESQNNSSTNKVESKSDESIEPNTKALEISAEEVKEPVES